MTKWITKKRKSGENIHIPLNNGNRISEREITLKKPDQTPHEIKNVKNLEKKARDMLKEIANISNVDILLDSMKRYTGLLSSYSPFNATLIQMYDPDYTIVRSKREWDRFGYSLKDDAKKIPILVPIGVPTKHMPGEIVKFIEEKRAEGLSDEIIDHLVHKKFGQSIGYTHVFKTGYVYDKRDVLPNPNKKQLQSWDIDMTSQELYETAKKFAEQNHIRAVEGNTDDARGWSTGAEIHIMKVPGEDKEAVNTILHELAHSLLGHSKLNMPRDKKEAEAELVAYLVAEHYGINLHKEAKAYIASWLEKKGDKFTEENIDRSLKTARNIINGIDQINYTGAGKSEKS
jgi:hypothetical protein